MLSRIALLTIKGRNDEKVRFAADHVRKEIEQLFQGTKENMIMGPAPAPLARAETFYRYQIMVRTRQMSKVSAQLAEMNERLTLPEGLTLTIDVDPANLA